MPEFNVFDKSDDLRGARLIEASAGTGKTFSLVEIVKRLVAQQDDPVDITRLLLVTFTNAATNELSTRLKAGLEEKLRQETDADATARLEQALEHFDDACIFTIHGFCRKMLTEYTFVHGGSYGVELQLEDDQMRQQVVDEFVRDKVRSLPEESVMALVGLQEALSLLLKDMTGRDSALPFRVVPDDGSPIAECLKEFPGWAAKRLFELKTQAGVMSGDEMLALMARKVREVPEFARAVRERFDAVLIDEFQDTDSVQYAAFRELFLQGENRPRHVIFVGDPKQAIYRFRRAELETYIRARNEIGNVYTLGNNYRTTRALLDVFNLFFGNGNSDKPSRSFFSDDILYRPVGCGNPAKTPVLEQGEDGTLRPLPVFEVLFNQEETSEEEKELARGSVDQLRALEDEWIASDIDRLINGKCFLGAQRVKPSDIAILVSKREQANGVIEALRSRRIPVCLSSNEDVFKTEQADEILAILKVMEDPTDLQMLAAARTSRIFGDTLKTFGADQDAIVQAQVDVRETLERYRHAGLTAAFTFLFERRTVVKRLMPLKMGRQYLRNYRHVLELLQEQTQTLPALAGLIRWFESEKASDECPENRHLRIESDERLVTVETIHASKGLEYPIVYLAHASAKLNPRAVKPGFFKAEESGCPVLEMVLDAGAIPEEQIESENLKQMQEEARKAYVAMTRATSRLVLPLMQKRLKKDGSPSVYTGENIYWKVATGQPMIANKADTERQFNEVIERIKDAVKADMPKICGDLSAIAGVDFSDTPDGKRVDDLIRITHPLNQPKIKVRDGCEKTEPTAYGVDDSVCIRSAWSTTSFSALRRGAAQAMPEQSPDPLEEEKPQEVSEGELTEEQKRDIVHLQGGTRIGTMLHEIFERTDFQDVVRKSEADFEDHIDRLLRPYRELLGQEYAFALPAVTEMVRNVLGAELPGGVVLSRVPMSQRYSELEFDLSVGAPDPDRQVLTEKRLIELLRILSEAHAVDPGYTPDYLAPGAINGFIKGFIDLFFYAEGKYWVIDWKSNSVAASARGYTPFAMARQMAHHCYRLQYLIYLVAVMRFLRSRLGPEADVYGLMGGAVYLFIRGVRKGVRDQGIVFDRPKRAVLECLDDAFSHGYSEKVVRQYAAQVRKEESHD